MAAPYYTPSALRTAVGTALQDTERFPDALLAGLIAEFEDTAERYRGTAYVKRDATYTYRPSRWTGDLRLPHIHVTTPVTTCTVDGTAQVVGDLIVAPDPLGDRLERVGGWPISGAVVVTYSHGYDSPPALILGACREYVRSEALLATNKQPRNASGRSDDSGWSYRDTTADWYAGRPTGWDVVDRKLNAVQDERIPGIA